MIPRGQNTSYKGKKPFKIKGLKKSCSDKTVNTQMPRNIMFYTKFKIK